MPPLEFRTIKHLLKRSVSQYPERPALAWVGEKPITYSQLNEQIQILSNILLKKGIYKGDRVAILSENHPNWGMAYLAITSMGAVAVPILPDFHANEVQHILRHSSAKIIFISEKQLPKIYEFDSSELEHCFLINDFSILPAERKIQPIQSLIKEGQKELNKLKKAALKVAMPSLYEVHEEDLAVIIYTSGTTGHSKGVMLTHKNLVSNVQSTLIIQNVTCEDRLLSILPLSHSYECTVGFLIPISEGASVYYLNKPPVPAVLLPALQKVRPTMMLTVPLIIEKIYKNKVLPAFTKSSVIRYLYSISWIRKKLHAAAAAKLMKQFGGKLHFFGIGGALLSPDAEQFMRDGKFPYAIGYGLTETSPLIAGCSPELTRFRSTGPAIPGVQVKIHKHNSADSEGEIWVRGDSVMKGYYKDSEKTSEVISEDGWLKTGDLGLMDEDGYIYIKGRLKNMIVGPSGENIYPEELESIINKNDCVLESLVYMDEGHLAARVHLNYEKLDIEFQNKKLSETQAARLIQEKLEEIRNKLNTNVSSFSRIKKIIEQAEPFEKTPTKKIKRYLYI